MALKTLNRPMAESKRKDIAAKIDAEVIRKAKIVAAFEDKSLAEYLSEVLKPIVERDLNKHTRRVQEDRNPPPKR